MTRGRAFTNSIAAARSHSIVAWARNAIVALAALETLKAKNPGDRFEQRRRSWVERS